MNPMMVSCRRAAELMSQRMDEPLGVVDSLRLRMHLAMCHNCRNVERQLQALRTLSADLFAEPLHDGDEPSRG